MNKISIIEKSKVMRVGKEPVVLVPLKLWQKMEDALEDQEAASSKRYVSKIQRSRNDVAKNKIIYPFV